MKTTNKGEGVNHLWEKTITVSILQTADQEAEGLKSARGFCYRMLFWTCRTDREAHEQERKGASGWKCQLLCLYYEPKELTMKITKKNV